MMKKKIGKLIISAVALVFTIASLSLVFAWYTNVDKIGSIDATVSDINISYTIDDSNVKNEKSYEITNLAFFDLNNTNELEYFIGMVKPIKLTINNLDNTKKSITIGYEATKTIKTNDSNEKTSVAYPVGIINENLIDISNKTNIGGLIPASASNTDSSFIDSLAIELAPSSAIEVYLYVFGAQDISSSDNSFLAPSLSYKFTLTIEGINIKN